MLITTAISISINLIVSAVPDGFDCLYLFGPLVSQVVVLGVKGQVLDLGSQNQVFIDITVSGM